MTAESLPSRGDSDPLKYYPNPEDWDTLQGGKPRVFRDPRRPKRRWIVLHVYDEHPSPRRRFASGAIVETIPPDESNIPTSRFLIERRGEDGKLIERDIIIPSFMRLDVHGEPCEYRSSSSGQTYDRITSQYQYETFIKTMSADGMEELRYGFQDGALKLFPVHLIRPPRPLDISQAG